jgi:hypothetical protein
MLLASLGGIILIELGYQAGLKSSEGPIRVLFGLPVNSLSLGPWLLASALVVVGLFGLRLANDAAGKPSALLREQTELPHG